MRILDLTRDFPPRACGGISTAVGGLVGASADAGLEVAVVSFDAWRPKRTAVATPPAALEEGRVPVLRLTAPSQLPAVHALAGAWRPRLLHVHHGMLWPLAVELRAEDAIAAEKTVHVVQREMNARRGVAEHTRSLAGALALSEAPARSARLGRSAAAPPRACATAGCAPRHCRPSPQFTANSPAGACARRAPASYRWPW